MQQDIKDLIETKIQSLFDKLAKKKFDPIFTKNQNKLRSILHTATIKHGHVLEAAYLNAVKLEKKEFKVWCEPEFCISEEAHNKSNNQTSQRILESTEPYGECMLVRKKPRKVQVDMIVYDHINEEVSAYEIKRGGVYHDSGKKKTIIADVIAVQVLLKDYAKQKNLKVKKTNSLIISHYGATFTTKDWKNLQINGDKIDEHFSAKISKHLKEAQDYWIKCFKPKYSEMINKLADEL